MAYDAERAAQVTCRRMYPHFAHVSTMFCRYMQVTMFCRYMQVTQDASCIAASALNKQTTSQARTSSCSVRVTPEMGRLGHPGGKRLRSAKYSGAACKYARAQHKNKGSIWRNYDFKAKVLKNERHPNQNSNSGLILGQPCLLLSMPRFVALMFIPLITPSHSWPTCIA